MNKFRIYDKQEYTLLFCPHCKTFYKGVTTHKLERLGSEFATYIKTDYGDTIKFDDYKHFICPKCNKIVRKDDNLIVTEDWISNLFFKIKGVK